MKPPAFGSCRARRANRRGSHDRLSSEVPSTTVPTPPSTNPLIRLKIGKPVSLKCRTKSAARSGRRNVVWLCMPSKNRCAEDVEPIPPSAQLGSATWSACAARRLGHDREVSGGVHYLMRGKDPLRLLQDAEAFEVHSVTSSDHREAVNLSGERHGRSLSLVDCRSFVAMRRPGHSRLPSLRRRLRP